MTEEQKETRAEEVARVRSYLTSQARRRSNTQLIDALVLAHQQFVLAVNAIPEDLVRATPQDGEWSTMDVLLHVHRIAGLELWSLTAVLERAEKPEDVPDVLESAARELTRVALLTDLERSREQLIALVQRTDPQSEALLDIVWSHPEFGAMNWREWLLFARVHALDHARQVEAIAAALLPEGETGV